MLKLSLIISITGIFFLLLLSLFLPPKQYKISEINNELLGKQIKIQGKIISQKILDKKTSFTLLKIKDKTATIEAVCNCKQNLTNQYVQVQGKIQEYNQKLQVQAEKIENVN